MSDVTLEDIASLAKRRGFIFQGSEIYGGLAGTWDYGPLGVALKRNIENLWWKTFVEDRDDMYGVDAAVLMNQKVWQASGHVDTFSDPMIECSNCHVRFRADRFPNRPPTGGVGEDNLWYEKWLDNYRSIHGFGDKTAGQRASDAESKSFAEKKVVCPNCLKFADFGKPRQFNMMFKTNVGPVDDESSIAYLRPETAQGIFVNFKNIVDTFYPDLPFGIAQIGKAFRNEISPRDFIFRTREFEQMEIEYFVHPNEWEKYFEEWVRNIESFLQQLGINGIEKLEVPEEDRAHYSKRTIDFEFNYPSFGKSELLGLAYRTDFDLKNHQDKAGKSMVYRPKDGGESFIPHVIEPSFGVERAILAVLASAYTQDEINGEKRTYLKLPAHLAPVKVAVSPLLKNKPELVTKAREVYETLKKEFGAVMWDDNGNIGKRYRRQDEIGTPYCVTIDFDSLQNNDVTLRDRDTTKQERVKIDELNAHLKASY